MDTYKRRSNKGFLHNVRNSRKTQEHMFRAGGIGLGSVAIAALLSRRGKRVEAKSVPGITGFSMRSAHQRRSPKGRISFVQAFQSNDRAIGKRYINQLHRERIKKYGDLGRLDKEFFHLATWGQYK